MNSRLIILASLSLMAFFGCKHEGRHRFPDEGTFVCIGGISVVSPQGPQLILQENEIRYFIGGGVHGGMRELWCEPSKTEKALELLESAPEDENGFARSGRSPYTAFDDRFEQAMPAPVE